MSKTIENFAFENIHPDDIWNEIRNSTLEILRSESSSISSFLPKILSNKTGTNYCIQIVDDEENKINRRLVSYFRKNKIGVSFYDRKFVATDRKRPDFIIKNRGKYSISYADIIGEKLFYNSSEKTQIKCLKNCRNILSSYKIKTDERFHKNFTAW